MGVESQLWRALAVFRVVALVYEVVRYLHYAGQYDQAGWGWAAMAVATGWTVVVVLGDRDPLRRRAGWWRAADLVVVAAVVAAAARADEVTLVADLTIPALWAAGAVVAVGLGRGWGTGVASALALGMELVLLVGRVTAAIVNAVVVMAVVGGLMGWVDRLAREAERRGSRAAAAEAQQRERERLSRAVHDGVLQVLGLVQHRAPDLGPDGVELGRLAGQQESALRALIARLPSDPATGADGSLAEAGVVDLGEVLASLGSGRVSVAVPAQVVAWSADDAAEIGAAVRAALDNVDRHAGADAHAWVLLEEEDDEVVVTVRDNGVGMEQGRPAAAVREGRLGLSRSIVERVRSLGGSADVSGSPGRGVEVELRLPRSTDGGER